jgi:hypothetical protein
LGYHPAKPPLNACSIIDAGKFRFHRRFTGGNFGFYRQAFGLDGADAGLCMGYQGANTVLVIKAVEMSQLKKGAGH